MLNQDTSTGSFNLVEQPWFPVAGEERLRTLAEIFTAPAPKRLSGDATLKAALFRFLLSIVHASSHVPDEDAWHRLSPETLAENARNYLLLHKERFDLYDPVRPFLQFPQLKERNGKEYSLCSLLLYTAVGNKTLLTDWNREHILSDAEKARLLIRAVGYSCGGKQYDAETVLSDHIVKKTARPGTLLGSLGYLHTYMLGDDLWDSLRRNLLTEQEILGSGLYPEGLGEPFWMHMPAGEDDERARQYRKSYFGRLVPLDKFLFFTEEKVLKTDGIAYETLPGISQDPAVTAYLAGKEFRFLWTRTDKRPWRQLTALLNFLQNRTSSPLFLSLGMKKLRGENLEKVSIWTGGAEVSGNAGEQYLSGANDFVESEFSLPTHIIESNDQWLAHYERLMHDLDQQAKALYSAVARYNTLLDNQDGKAALAVPGP